MSRLAHWIGLTILFLAMNRGLASDGTEAVYRLRIVSTKCERESCRVTTAYASAVAIGHYNPGKEILVTAAHAVDGNPRKLEVDINGQWTPGSVLAVSKEHHDLALIGVTLRDRKLQTVSIAESRLSPNTAVTLAGYPGGNEQHRRTSHIIASRYGERILTVATPSRPGDSGGGVFNNHAELAAVIFATAPVRRPTHTLATDATAIRQLIRDTFQAEPPRVHSIQSATHGTPQPHSASLNPRTPCRCRDQLDRIETLTRQLQTLESELRVLKSTPAEVTSNDLLPIENRLQRLENTQIPVHVLTPNGTVQSKAVYRLGEPIQLRLIPRRE